MITISLDEYGQFEEYEGSLQIPTYIAGLLFDDHDIAGECDLERKRIEAFYKAVISEAKDNSNYNAREFEYPQALHIVPSKPQTYSHFVVRPVKSLINQHLPEFLRTGQYRGRQLRDNNNRVIPKREGNYQLFVCLKSAKGKKN